MRSCRAVPTWPYCLAPARRTRLLPKHADSIQALGASPGQTLFSERFLPRQIFKGLPQVFSTLDPWALAG